ncbi:MAG: hypothetical protein R2810_02785 [Flavobacteriales bacterium]|nr:hypothetical protein [Flavobacteriales bacterium]
MRTPTTIILMLASLAAFAQEDSTATEGLDGRALEIYAGSKGAKMRVSNPYDTLHEGDKNDTIRITTARKLITIITSPRTIEPEEIDVEQEMREDRTERRNLFTYWSGLEIGLNNFMTPGGSFDLPEEDKWMELEAGRSRWFAINFMEQKFEFGSHHAGLLTGLGLEFTSYHFANNVLLAADADSTYAFTEDLPGYSKNKFRQIGLRVPLMFEFNTKRAPLPTEELILSGKDMDYDRKGNFHLAFGVVGSWYFDTMYKQKYREDGERVKDRRKASYNTLPYRLAARGQIGFGSLNLFAEYGLTSFFEDGKGPDLVPVSVGITLLGFN